MPLAVDSSWETGVEPARLGLLAASSRWATERFLARQGASPAFVLTGPDIVAQGRRYRRFVRSRGVTTVAVHSAAWRRETYVPVYELALALAPADRRLIIDDETGRTREVSRRELLEALAAEPLGVARGAMVAADEVLRHVLARSQRTGDVAGARTPPAGSWVLAIWKGAPESDVGGAVTHISGILGALRSAGFRVALLTCFPPPRQVDAAADHVQVTPVVGSGSRVTWDMERLTSNRLLRKAGLALGRRVGARLVYQRHAFLMTAGLDVARSLDVPLVLEWNASEVWARAHWERAGPLGRWGGWGGRALGSSIERRVVREADLVAAVSDRAADQARAVGVSEDRLVVVPNGVDADACEPDGGRRLGKVTGAARLGWIGSFGPWHGAEVLVRSLTHLPGDVEAVLVGDGLERPGCMALARDERVDQRIEWTGAVPHAEALRRLATCDLLVSPHVPLAGTPFFGSPTKLFEYMALGKPIVASRLEQLEQVLEDGRTARLVEPGDPRALAAGIRAVLESPDRGKGLGDRAREVARQSHTWDARAAAILQRLGHAPTPSGG